MTHPDERVTDHVAYLVERNAMEIGVTLVVDGTVIAGLMTPTRRYHHWCKAGTAVTLATGNGQRDASTEPPTDREREQIMAEWLEAVGDEGDENEFDRVRPLLAHIALRDAQIGMRMGAAGWSYASYLLIAAERVSAITFGVSQEIAP